jgi:glycosyltransferase involved in cell wall biosynthesis
VPTLVRVIVREDHTSIFDSVYVQSAEKLKERGWDIQFVLLSFIGTWLRYGPKRLASELDSQLLEKFGRSVLRLPLPPARLSGLWGADDVFRAYLWFGKRLRHLGDDVIFEGNNSEATAAVIKAVGKSRRFAIVYRCWGIDEEEYIFSLTGRCDRDQVNGAQRREAERLFLRQKLAVERADHIVCVSHAMVDHLMNRFGCRREKMSVVPCAVDTAPFQSATHGRNELRRQLRLQNKLVLVYCGAMQRYQMPSHGLRLFKRILASEPNAHYLILTRETEAMKKLCLEEQLPEENRTIVALDHREVPRYLAVADAGLLLRDRCPVNRVASPVKFGEYLAAGLPVVISREIGDYSALVSRESLGVVLDELDPTDSQVNEVVELLRHCGNRAVACLEQSHYLDTHQLAEQVCQQFHSILELQKCFK